MDPFSAPPLSLYLSNFRYNPYIYNQDYTLFIINCITARFNATFFIRGGLFSKQFRLLGLYPLYNSDIQATDWYYLLQNKSAAGGQDAGTGSAESQVAIEMPKDAGVRAKYKVTGTPKNIAQK